MTFTFLLSNVQFFAFQSHTKMCQNASFVLVDSDNTEDESGEPQVSMETKKQSISPRGQAVDSQPTSKNLLSHISRKTCAPSFSILSFLVKFSLTAR